MGCLGTRASHRPPSLTRFCLLALYSTTVSSTRTPALFLPPRHPIQRWFCRPWKQGTYRPADVRRRHLESAGIFPNLPQAQYSSDARPSIAPFCAIQSSKFLGLQRGYSIMQQAVKGSTRRHWGVLIAGESWMKFNWRKAGNPTLGFKVLLVSAQATYQITILWLYLGQFTFYFMASTIHEYRNRCGGS